MVCWTSDERDMKFSEPLDTFKLPGCHNKIMYLWNSFKFADPEEKTTEVKVKLVPTYWHLNSVIHCDRFNQLINTWSWICRQNTVQMSLWFSYAWKYLMADRHFLKLWTFSPMKSLLIRDTVITGISKVKTNQTLERLNIWICTSTTCN